MNPATPISVSPWLWLNEVDGLVVVDGAEKRLTIRDAALCGAVTTLARSPGLSIEQLATELHVDEATLGVQIDTLQRLGVITELGGAPATPFSAWVAATTSDPDGVARRLASAKVLVVENAISEEIRRLLVLSGCQNVSPVDDVAVDEHIDLIVGSPDRVIESDTPRLAFEIGLDEVSVGPLVGSPWAACARCSAGGGALAADAPAPLLLVAAGMVAAAALGTLAGNGRSLLGRREIYSSRIRRTTSEAVLPDPACSCSTSASGGSGQTPDADAWEAEYGGDTARPGDPDLGPRALLVRASKHYVSLAVTRRRDSKLPVPVRSLLDVLARTVDDGVRVAPGVPDDVRFSADLLHAYVVLPGSEPGSAPIACFDRQSDALVHLSDNFALTSVPEVFDVVLTVDLTAGDRTFGVRSRRASLRRGGLALGRFLQFARTAGLSPGVCGCWVAADLKAELALPDVEAPIARVRLRRAAGSPDLAAVPDLETLATDDRRSSTLRELAEVLVPSDPSCSRTSDWHPHLRSWAVDPGRTCPGVRGPAVLLSFRPDEVILNGGRNGYQRMIVETSALAGVLHGRWVESGRAVRLLDEVPPRLRSAGFPDPERTLIGLGSRAVGRGAGGSLTDTRVGR